MKKFDYLLRYIQRTSLQISLIRFEEAFVMAKNVSPIKKPILDIGVSDGIFGEVLFNNKKGLINFGIDIDNVALRFAQKRKVYQEVLYADARQLPFPDNFFNTILSNQSLEHIKNIDKVFKEVARVIRRGGKFVFLVPTIYLDDYWLTSALFKMIGLRSIANYMHKKRNKIFNHYNIWSIKKWSKLLNVNSFKIKYFRYVGLKKVYFISEIFWPLRIANLVFSRIFHKIIPFPRRVSVILAKILAYIINNEDDIIPKKGPTMLIIAQKK